MNVVIDNGNVLDTDIPTLYGAEDVIISSAKNLTELCTSLGLYKSKSECVRANRVGPIPSGWNVFKGNKTTTLYVWNPTDRD